MKRCLLIGFGFVVGLGALEALLRVHNPFITRLRADRIVLPVNQRSVIRNRQIPSLESRIVRTTNALGFRGPNPPPALDHDLSILVVGGSTAECAYVSDTKTWPARLEGLLKRAFHPLWLNNAGLDGHSTFGHLVLLRDYVAPLHPKAVVFLVGANEMGRSDLIPLEQSHVQAGLSTDSPEALIKSLSPYSEVAATLLNLYRVERARRSGLAHVAMNVREAGDAEVSPERRARLLEEHRQHFVHPYEVRLRALIEYSRQEGIWPALITQPALYGAGRDELTGVDLARVRVGDVNGETQWALLELYNDVTRHMAAAMHVPLVDLARAMPKSSRYFYDFLHFTEAGCLKVSEIVSAGLERPLAAAFPDYYRRVHGEDRS